MKLLAPFHQTGNNKELMSASIEAYDGVKPWPKQQQGDWKFSVSEIWVLTCDICTGKRGDLPNESKHRRDKHRDRRNVGDHENNQDLDGQERQDRLCQRLNLDARNARRNE